MPTIIFEADTEYGTYKDAIHLPDDIAYTDQELDAMKLERVNKWITALNAPTLDIPDEIPGE